MKNLVDYIGVPALLEQTAEECMELGFACIKLSRFLRGENRVHGHTEEELVKSLNEECADVNICIDELIRSGTIDIYEYFGMISEKRKRMANRMAEEFDESAGEQMNAEDVT